MSGFFLEKNSAQTICKLMIIDRFFLSVLVYIQEISFGHFFFLEIFFFLPINVVSIGNQLTRLSDSRNTTLSVPGICNVHFEHGNGTPQKDHEKQGNGTIKKNPAISDLCETYGGLFMESVIYVISFHKMQQIWWISYEVTEAPSFLCLLFFIWNFSNLGCAGVLV